MNHRVCHANTHMALKLVHHLRHTSTQSCPTTRPPSNPPPPPMDILIYQGFPPLVAHEVHCYSTFQPDRPPLAPSEFTVPRVHVLAASRATCSIGWGRVRATMAGDLPVAATTASLILSYHISHIYRPAQQPCNL